MRKVFLTKKLRKSGSLGDRQTSISAETASFDKNAQISQKRNDYHIRQAVARKTNKNPVKNLATNLFCLFYGFYKVFCYY